MSKPLVLLPALTAFLLCSGGAGESQTPRGLGSSPADVSVERGDELHARMRPREALTAYRNALTEDPGHVGALVRAARECSVLGRLASDPDDALRWFEEAEELARRAVERDPAAPGAHYRLAASLDQRAHHGGPRDRIRLAAEIRDETRFVLERDSAHAGAHHVLGRWHAEIERLRGVARFFARHLLGEAVLGEASWTEALQHLGRAVERAPESLTFRLSLAEAYLERGRVDDARAHLREILELPSVQPVDPQVKQRAQELLKANP